MQGVAWYNYPGGSAVRVHALYLVVGGASYTVAPNNGTYGGGTTFYDLKDEGFPMFVGNCEQRVDLVGGCPNFFISH